MFKNTEHKNTHGRFITGPCAIYYKDLKTNYFKGA